MKSIVFVFMSLILMSCEVSINSKPPASNCFKLEMCEILTGGTGKVNLVTVPCVAGFTNDGKRTGEMYRFLSRETLEIWSTLNPTAKACQ